MWPVSARLHGPEAAKLRRFQKVTPLSQVLLLQKAQVTPLLWLKQLPPQSGALLNRGLNTKDVGGDLES